MKKVTITGAKRELNGTKNAEALRREKKVPCVLYGGETIQHFSVDEAAIGKLVFTPEVFRVELDIDGQKNMAFIQETQFHPVSDRIQHVDFLALDETKEAQVTLSIKLSGQSIGVRNGGNLSQVKRKLRVKGLPSDLPEHLDIDITKLEVGQSLRIRDLDIKGLTVLEPASEVVAHVKMPKQSKEDVAAAAAAAAAPGAPAAAKK